MEPGSTGSKCPINQVRACVFSISLLPQRFARALKSANRFIGAVAAFLGSLAYEPLLKLPAPDRSLFVIVVLFGAVAGILVPSCGPLGAVTGSWMVVITFGVLGHIYLGLSEISWGDLGLFTALPMVFVWLAFWLHSLWARAWRA